MGWSVLRDFLTFYVTSINAFIGGNFVTSGFRTGYGDIKAKLN